MQVQITIKLPQPVWGNLFYTPYINLPSTTWQVRYACIELK